MSGRARAWCWFAAKAVLGVALVAAAVVSLDWRRMVEVLGELDATTIALASALVLAQYAVLALRWWVMVRRAVPMSAGRHAGIYFAANLVNAVTPANIGGDAYRVVALRRAGSTAELIVLLVRERLIGLAGFLVVYIAAMGWLWATGDRSAAANATMNLALAVAIAGLAALVCGRPLVRWAGGWSPIARRPRLQSLNRHTGEALRLGNPAQAVALGALTFGAIVLWGGAVWAVARQVEPGIGFAALLAVVVFAEVIRLVPITVQGLGVREGAYALGFAAMGFEAEAGFLTGAAAYLILGAGLLLTGCLGWATTHGGTRRPAARARTPDA